MAHSVSELPAWQSPGVPPPPSVLALVAVPPLPLVLPPVPSLVLVSPLAPVVVVLAVAALLELPFGPLVLVLPVAPLVPVVPPVVPFGEPLVLGAVVAAPLAVVVADAVPPAPGAPLSASLESPHPNGVASSKARTRVRQQRRR